MNYNLHRHLKKTSRDVLPVHFWTDGSALWMRCCSETPVRHGNERAIMTPDKNDKKTDPAESTKCAHASCKCRLSAQRPYGNYCSEHCQEAGEMTELRCGCEHVQCR